MTTTEPRTDPRRALVVQRVFDGLSLRDEPTVVHLDGPVITGVDAPGAGRPDGVDLEDLGDVTLLPGLIDAHTHLVFDATDDAVAHVQSVDDETLLRQMHERAARMLACGVTTARDLGDRQYLSLVVRETTAADPTAGPALRVAGPPITTVGGHCFFLGGETDGTNGLAGAVGERAERGVDVIKVMTTGGRMTLTTLPHESQFDLDQLRSAADAAHSLGLPIAGHAHGRQGVADCIAAGFDTIEHVSFFVASGRAEPVQSVIDDLAASGRYASVTAGLLPGAPIPPPLLEMYPMMQEHVGNMVRSGVRVILGPDGGISPAKPHEVLPYAIADFVGCGVTPHLALTTATATAAEALGVADRVGRVRPGFDADLLVVRGDPLGDIAAIHDVAAVYRRGQRVRPPAPA